MLIKKILARNETYKSAYTHVGCSQNCNKRKLETMEYALRMARRWAIQLHVQGVVTELSRYISFIYLSLKVNKYIKVDIKKRTKKLCKM